MCKKKLIFLTVLVMLLSFSMIALADEILFNGVPWGISPYELRDKMPSSDIYMSFGVQEDSYTPYSGKTAERLLEHSKNVLMGNPEFFSEHKVAFSSGAMFFDDGPKVAGFNLSGVILYFSKDLSNGIISDDDKKSHFCSAEYVFDIVDGENAYSVLANKLDKLYGTCNIQSGEYSGMIRIDKRYNYKNYIEIRRYDGDNGTHAELEYVKTVVDGADQTGYSISLLYWKDEYETQMIEMDKLLAEKEHNSRLNEERNVDADDFSGL